MASRYGEIDYSAQIVAGVINDFAEQQKTLYEFLKKLDTNQALLNEKLDITSQEIQAINTELVENRGYREVSAKHVEDINQKLKEVDKQNVVLRDEVNVIKETTSILNDQVTRSYIVQETEYALEQLAILDHLIRENMVVSVETPPVDRRVNVHEFKRTLIEFAETMNMQIVETKVINLMRMYTKNPQWDWAHSGTNYYVRGYMRK